MPDLERWLCERLKPIEESAFCKAPHRKVPEPCKKSAKLAYFSVPLASGVGTAILMAPHNDAGCHNALVILFHSLGDDCTYPHWHWMEALVARGLAVLSIDWDGHGVAGGSYLDLQQVTRTLPLLLQKLYGQAGEPEYHAGREGPDCFLMGHSAGAALSLLAVTRPEMAAIVKGVVAVSPSIVMNSGSQRELTSYFRAQSWLQDLGGRIPYYGFAGVIPGISHFRNSRNFPVRVRVGTPYTEQLRSFVHETFEVRRVLSKVNVPVLWLHGARDTVVPMERASKLMREIPSALFCHMDESRGHLTMAFSSAIPNYAARFIESCIISAQTA